MQCLKRQIIALVFLLAIAGRVHGQDSLPTRLPAVNDGETDSGVLEPSWLPKNSPLPSTFASSGSSLETTEHATSDSTNIQPVSHLESVVMSEPEPTKSFPGCDAPYHEFFEKHREPLSLGGWLQQGFTFNPSDPDNRSNSPVLFNDPSNDYQLNQFYLYAERKVETSPSSWGLGGRVDLNYGTDSRFVTIPGLEREQDRTRRWNSESSDYGLAIPQAYVEIGTPIGPFGSSIIAGHFLAQSGYESFTAPDNFFYSHSYSFVYGQPFTHSGAIWNVKLSPTFAASIGGTTGWDNLYSDIDQWGVRYAILKQLYEGRTTIGLTGHSGQDYTGVRTVDGEKMDDRHWVNLLLKHQFNRDWYYVLSGDFGYQKGAVVVLDNTLNTVGFDDGHWWGVTQYLVHQLNTRWSSGLRLEWFRDEGNSRVGLPIEYTVGGPAFDGGDYVALTGGVNFKPHKNVLLRSELRWDYSNVESNPDIPGGVAGIRPFDDRSSDNQITVGLDAVVVF